MNNVLASSASKVENEEENEKSNRFVKVIDIRRICNESVMKYISEMKLVSFLKLDGLIKYEILNKNDEILKLSCEKLKIIESVPFSQKILPSLISDICNNLETLHECGLIHGNVKISNILINEESEFVLSDYCLYNIKCKEEETEKESINNKSIEELYAREISYKSDIWKLGILIYICLTNKNAFYNDDENNNNSIYNIIERMKKGDYIRLNKNEINNDENSNKIYNELFDKIFKYKINNINEIKQIISPLLLLNNNNNNKENKIMKIESLQIDNSLQIINKMINIPSLSNINKINNSIFKDIKRIYIKTKDIYYIIYLMRLYYSIETNNNNYDNNNICLFTLLNSIDNVNNKITNNSIFKNIIMNKYNNSVKITKLKNVKNINIIFSNIYLLLSSLKELEISEIHLSHYIYIICNKITQNLPKLIKLSLIDCYLRDVDVIYLSDSLSEMNNRIECLSLCNNDEIELNESMKYLSSKFEYLNKIKSFTIQNYVIERNSFKIFLSNLSSLHSLNYLNLRNNNIDDDLFQYLSSSLLKLSKLSNLYLSYNKISEEELYQKYLKYNEINNKEMNEICMKYEDIIKENYNDSVSSIYNEMREEMKNRGIEISELKYLEFDPEELHFRNKYQSKFPFINLS